MKKKIAVIPARYNSSRFPGKPLAMISGKTMIRRVYERVEMVKCFEDIIVATDDERIKDEVDSFGGKAVMTGECSCGTERVYEAIKNENVNIVINIQGDEPLIAPEMIMELISLFDDKTVQIATLKKKILEDTEINAPNVVKVITDINNDAVYFSRFAIPFNRSGQSIDYYKHIGIYGYTKEFLEQFVKLPESKLEAIEKLEQLRAIENGYKIKVKETTYETIGVDLPEQIELIEERLFNGE